MKSKSDQTHQVRIIGGIWKRTTIQVIDAQGLRPTPDRVRETLFNWINHIIYSNWQSQQCLDMFAGSGALGFEAASRGAQKVVMIENNAAAMKHIEITKEKLKAEQIVLKKGDALIQAQAMMRQQEKFSVIFLDPPFHLDLLPKLLPLCVSLLKAGGIVYVESEQALPFNENTVEDEKPEWCQKWNMIRQDKAGSVHFHLLQYQEAKTS